MQKNIRETALYREAEGLYRTLRQPGTGRISDIAEVHGSPHGDYAVFAGSLLNALKGTPTTRICRVDLESGDTRVLTFGPNIDRLPKYSPDGRSVAFLSDRHIAGNFQLYLLDPVSGVARATPFVDGWVEYLHWSPDGMRILLGVAGHGADLAGAQGAIAGKQLADDAASWMPTPETGDESYRWRQAWVYEVAGNSVRKISAANINVWEAVWCSDAAIAVVASRGPLEGLWYSACLHVIDLATGASRQIHAPAHQLGWPSASPSGKHLAIVEAICSDRWLVAGELLVIETASGKVQRVDTREIDITYTEWLSDRRLLLAGHRGFDTVLALYQVDSGILTESWNSHEITTGGRYATVSSLNDMGDCVLSAESYVRAPEVGIIRAGEYRTVVSFDCGYAEQVRNIDTIERLKWSAPDGLEIHGWLLKPRGNAPHPLVMLVHGGPVWHWRPAWLGRTLVPSLMLLKRGYAVFFPNPRGSSGRGQEFTRRVLGEMAGPDTYDYLSGLDHLVDRGIADPKRLGVMGGSYGGLMTSWLVTQDSRFAAAISIAPVTNMVSGHLLSNIPHFVALFLGDRYTKPGGKYFQRSAIMHAHRVTTPTLNICGALDRCTPPSEAAQFHNALLEHGVESVLLTYPEEGHGVRKFPAIIDYTARIVGWFEEHLRAASPASRA